MVGRWWWKGLYNFFFRFFRDLVTATFFEVTSKGPLILEFYGTIPWPFKPCYLASFGHKLAERYCIIIIYEAATIGSNLYYAAEWQPAHWFELLPTESCVIKGPLVHPEEFVLTVHTHGFLCYESMSIVKLYILSVSVFHVLCDYFCFTQFGGSSCCLKFVKFRDTAPLNPKKGLFVSAL